MASTTAAVSSVASAGNPIAPGWYADPDVGVFDGQYWVYPTFSDAYEKQLHFDAFSSKNLVTWQKHERILDSTAIAWAKMAMWAPCVVKNGEKYFMFFSANDVHPGEVGGIGVAVADAPGGPFKDYLGKPLINEIVHGAQPIDQAVFQDPDGQWWILYGGWGHCNLAKLKADFTELLPDADGKIFHEITPKGYVEGPMMLFRAGRVYFMWSEGAWTDSTYQVAYAIADTLHGPFTRIGTIIQPNPELASGAGHHSVLKFPGRDEYAIVYHRRPLGETDGNHRETCIDQLEFNADGTIKPVIMTAQGMGPRPLK